MTKDCSNCRFANDPVDKYGFMGKRVYNCPKAMRIVYPENHIDCSDFIAKDNNELKEE